jgi:Ca2+-binding EF-hand superfamily protein
MKTFPMSALAIACALALSPAFAGDNGDDDGHKGHTSAQSEMKMMDTDKNGRITMAEHTMGAKKMFEKIDADYDGRVTATEMDAAHKDMPSAHSSKPVKSSANKIKTIDTDSDGVISAEEHEKGSQKMFSQLDKNEDGNLTQAEIQAGHDRMLSAEEK